MNAGLAPARRMRRLAAQCLRPLLRHAARNYVAGERLDAALQVRARLAAGGIACTLGYFNADDEPVDCIVAADAAAITALAGSHDHLSLKPPALDFRATALHRLATQAAARRIRLHFDSHGPECADAGRDALQTLLATHPPELLGITIPAAWRRSPADAEWARAQRLPVRLVKGQWPDPQGAVADLRERFLALVDLLAGGGASVAVASHDVALAEHALRRLQQHGTPCELQLLHGLPMRAPLAMAARLGVPVRVYVPWGVGHLPYVIGKALEQPRLIAWLLRDACATALRRS